MNGAGRPRKVLAVFGEEIYRVVAEHASDGVLVYDAGTGRILYANPALEGLTLYTPAELRRMTVGDLLVCDHESGSAWDEGWIRRKDGSSVPVELYLSVIPCSGGHQEGCVLVCGRIREEMNSESFARSTIDSLSAHIAILDESGVIIATNRAWQRFAEANDADPAMVSEGANYLQVCELATGQDCGEAAAFAEGVRSVLSGRQESFELEYPCHSPTERRWFIGRVTRFSAAQPPRAVVAHENITRRKMAEEALRDQKLQFETILNQAADAIVVCDLHGRLTFANAAARSMALVDPEGTTLEDAPEVWGAVHHPDGRPIPVEEWSIPRALHGERTVGGEVRVVRPDGTHFDILISAAPLKNADGEIIGAVADFLDITGRKRVEGERERLRIREAVAHTQKEERRRTARDLHDVVLQDLSGALQSLQLAHLRAKNSGLELNLQEELEALRRAAVGLRTAIHDLRHEREQPLAEALESLVALNRRLASGCDIALSVEGSSWKKLSGEAGVELLRILQEALANARRHSGAENIRVVLRAEGGDVLAEVSDDGIGFEPGAVRRGVGLSAMRERVERLGGRLEIRSRPGGGTRVEVRVPSGGGTPGPRRL
jgi:PAS domain S-box-containing protein